MRETDDTLWYLATGPMAALALGAALIPFREMTSASNLAFAFLALIIVVGHGGGRWPATATALASSLSLNFFLTRPYLTLTIYRGEDIIAFLGLTACGLVAATLGARRLDSIASGRELDVLFGALGALEQPRPSVPNIEKVLQEMCSAFPVSTVAARDPDGALIASAGDRSQLEIELQTASQPEVPIATEMAAWPSRRAVPLPVAGMRLPLVYGSRQVGRLDVWGNSRPADVSTRRAIRALAHSIAGMLGTGLLPIVPDPPRRPAEWMSAWPAGRLD
jgi:uncharacterized protein DUF4118